MDIHYARKLWKYIKSSVVKNNYEGEIYSDGKKVRGFHEWADKRNVIGIIKLHSAAYDETLYFLLIEWGRKDNIYLVIFPLNRSGPLIEIQNLDTSDQSSQTFKWKYSPSKQDGRNKDRKKYFEKHFISTDVNISFPSSVSTTSQFIDEIFQLVENRLKADELSKKVPTDRDSFPEGKEYEIRHRSRERSSKLVTLAKDKYKQEHGYLSCQICSFDFEKMYGKVGSGFIEAHHTIPISELKTEVETRIEHIALVCSNCHSMLHRKRPWLRINELKKLLA